jgi:hypothetical protein
LPGTIIEINGLSIKNLILASSFIFLRLGSFSFQIIKTINSKRKNLVNSKKKKNQKIRSNFETFTFDA